MSSRVPLAVLHKSRGTDLTETSYSYSILAVQRDLEKNVGSVFVELLQDVRIAPLFRWLQASLTQHHLAAVGGRRL